MSWDDLIDDAIRRQRKAAAPRIAVRDLLMGICEQVLNHHEGEEDLSRVCTRMVNDFLNRIEQIERVCGFKRPGEREPRQITCGNLVRGNG